LFPNHIETKINSHSKTGEMNLFILVFYI
jgi:hypothetical protein